MINRDKKVTIFFRESDYEGPEIVSYEFNPQTIDITNSSVTVTVTVNVTDKTGVADAPIIYVEYPENIGATQQTNHFSLTSGTPKNRTYSAEIEIPAGLQPGEWEVFSNAFTDSIGNDSIWPVNPTTQKQH